MNEENQTLPDDPVVPEQEATVEPVTEEVEPETNVEEDAKVLSQKQFESELGKRLARERRKWERESQSAVNQPIADKHDLKISDFESAEAYADALAEHRIAERIHRAQYEEMTNSFKDREEDARDKYADYDQLTKNNTKLFISPVMADAIKASELGPEIYYHLGNNPKESARINSLKNLAAQAKEIGVLEAKLKSSPPVKKTTNAPEPINPLNASRSNGVVKYKTTDPRSISQMSDSEWIRAERDRQVAEKRARASR